MTKIEMNRGETQSAWVVMIFVLITFAFIYFVPSIWHEIRTHGDHTVAVSKPGE